MSDFNKMEMLTFAKFFEKILVRDMMVESVVTIWEDDEVSLAEEKFVDNQINYLVVVSHDEKVVGLLSSKYLYKTLAPRKIVKEEMDYDPEIIIDGDTFYEKNALDAYILRNIMNKNPTVLKMEDTLKTALSLMADKKISCIPIVDSNKKPCGILSNHEVVTYLAKILKSQ